MKKNDMKPKRQQALEEAAREAIHAHYNCNGEYPCGQRDYCEHCNGHNTAFDCNECGADEFKEGFVAGAEWKDRQIPWISVDDAIPNACARGICQVKYVRGDLGIMAMRKVAGWAFPYIKQGYVTHWRQIVEY